MPLGVRATRPLRTYWATANVWLLGHHQDDQLETLLLRLARGAGADGLAGMPAARVLGVGSLIRPWLGIPRRILEQVAQERKTRLYRRSFKSKYSL